MLNSLINFFHSKPIEPVKYESILTWEKTNDEKTVGWNNGKFAYVINHKMSQQLNIKTFHLYNTVYFLGEYNNIQNAAARAEEIERLHVV